MSHLLTGVVTDYGPGNSRPGSLRHSLDIRLNRAGITLAASV
jgi:hypothetical protein